MDIYKTFKGKKQDPIRKNVKQIDDIQESVTDYERRGGIFEEDIRLTSIIETKKGKDYEKQVYLEEYEKRSLPPDELFKMNLNEMDEKYRDVLKITPMDFKSMSEWMKTLRFISFKNPYVFYLAFVLYSKKDLKKIQEIAANENIPMEMIVKYVRYFTNVRMV